MVTASTKLAPQTLTVRIITSPCGQFSYAFGLIVPLADSRDGEMPVWINDNPGKTPVKVWLKWEEGIDAADHLLASGWVETRKTY